MKGLELNQKLLGELFDNQMWNMRLYELLASCRALIPAGATIRHLSFDLKAQGLVLLYEEDNREEV